MATNVEWKARARNPQHQRKLAEKLADGPPELLEQRDTFFHVKSGRLKLRHFSENRGELIYYHRPDQAGPKQSFYSIVPTDQPEILHDILTQALGVRGEIRKHRWLYRVGQSRIHIDEVEYLGTFLEVEVVLEAGQGSAEGEALANALQAQLEVQNEDLITSAYIDLLSA